MEEFWRDIIDYEGLYQVSNLGKVKACERVVKHPKGGNKILKEKIRCLVKDSNGYEVVDLYKNGKGKMMKVHRLVSIAFIDNPEQKNQVNHKNGIKSDNFVNNLEWSTNQENLIHAFKIGLKKPTINNEKPVLMFLKTTNEFVSSFDSIAKASKTINCLRGDITSVLKNRQKSVRGYYFQYKN
jgi:RNA recognition motif-containing protein